MHQAYKRPTQARFSPPKAFYLSLGDSLGFGLQLDKLNALIASGTYRPDAFNAGYTDDFAARMRQIRPDQQVENLSCGGETTDTMINGGCFFKSHYGLPIHVDYTGAQSRRRRRLPAIPPAIPRWQSQPDHGLDRRQRALGPSFQTSATSNRPASLRAVSNNT